MLPFSLIKGKVLDSFREINDLLTHDFIPLKDWLGDSSKNGTYEPNRGIIEFSDFCVQPVRQEGRTTNQDRGVICRIEIDPEMGKVKRRMLAFLESPFAYGEPIEFKGQIRVVETKEKADEIKKQLERALAGVSNFGSVRTGGFGVFRKASISNPKSTDTSSETPEGVESAFRLRIDRPFCINGKRMTDNHFESLDHIPGSVLKGSVARLLLQLHGIRDRSWIEPSFKSNRFPKLCEHFSKIRFSEARPIKISHSAEGTFENIAKEQQRFPVTPPLTLACYPHIKGKYFDLANTPEDKILRDSKAPVFKPDWKSDQFALVQQDFGWNWLPRMRRVRTEIDPVTGKARENNLFSYGLVAPSRGKNGRAEVEFEWEACIGLEKVKEQDQQSILEELAELLKKGLPSLGKTHAFAEVHWLQQPSPAAVKPRGNPKDEGLFLITLQTEALMIPIPCSNEYERRSYQGDYEKFWNEISDKSLELVNFFAFEELYGGFVSKRADSKQYRPFLLTERGSVFCLKATEGNIEKARNLLNQWEKEGLNIPEYLKNPYPNFENNCPYVPENGFGAIMIDLECHFHSEMPLNQSSDEALRA
jgi:hypothetical protein